MAKPSYALYTRLLGKAGLHPAAPGFGAPSLGREFRSFTTNEALKSVRLALDCGLSFGRTRGGGRANTGLLGNNPALRIVRTDEGNGGVAKLRMVMIFCGSRDAPSCNIAGHQDVVMQNPFNMLKACLEIPFTRSFVVGFVLSLWGVDCLGNPASLPEPKMTFLDNGQVRVGMDLALGGAVTFLSSKDHSGNIINSADLGRQIQMSHYSGPWPFEVGHKKPYPAWAGLGWNPIQTGDYHLNPSKVVEQKNDGKEIYIKCIPMQWPLENVPGDCLFETWTSLEGPVIHMRFRCTNQRQDKTQYRPCPQELPAVYTISKLWRLISYTGDKPFTQAKLTQVSNDWHKPWPWTKFTATEGWAALVDDADWGLGVFKADGGEFHGGIHGDGRSDDPKHGSTAYVAPIHVENFDHNIVYEHRTEFMVGKLDDIRRRFNHMAAKTPPVWRFQHDRQHWTVRDASDQGFPIQGEWRINLGERKPRLESGVRCWRAEDAPALKLRLAYTGQGTSARVYWRCLGDAGFDDRRSLALPLNADGQFHTYQLDLKSSPTYDGLVTGIAIEPVAQPQPGATLAVESIEFLKSK